jgi:hypothetical protein
MKFQELTKDASHFSNFFGERDEQGFCPLFVLDASGFTKVGSVSSRTDQ